MPIISPDGKPASETTSNALSDITSDSSSLTSYLRSLPSVDKLFRSEGVRNLLEGEHLPHELILELVRKTLDKARQEIKNGQPGPFDLENLDQKVVSEAKLALKSSLRGVINATGVIIHTNLGRAPLSLEANLAVKEVAAGFNNLEYDLQSGDRGSRMSHVNDLLARLTGAEAALVVNNNAAAVFMVLSAFGRGREVILSRSQAVEIGGSFRIPDVIAQSGTKLVEVGTTNKTYLEDYASAITPQTSILMRVHSSNFKIIGFTFNPPLGEMARLAREQNLILVDDQGSGTFIDTARYGLGHEPTVQESIKAGVNLVTFSGDKLLGGPQAGLIAGQKQLIDRLKKHPLARALRVDKMTLAALQVTLQHYLRGEAETKIPVWRMISRQPEEIRNQAGRLKEKLEDFWPGVEVMAGLSTVGGGSLPGETLSTFLLALPVPAGKSADKLTQFLRQGQPAVVCRVEKERLLFDPRTLLEGQEEILLEILQKLAR